MIWDNLKTLIYTLTLTHTHTHMNILHSDVIFITFDGKIVQTFNQTKLYEPTHFILFSD